MATTPRPRRDIVKSMSRPVLFIALLIAAFLVTGFYWANPRLERTTTYRQSVAENVELVDIPLTAQEQRPAEPARPQVPIGADNEAEIEEITIGDTRLYDQDRVPVPAKIYSDAVPEEALTVNFWVLEEPPVLVREVPPKYPEIARRAGIEGVVIVRMLIDVDGQVLEASVQSGPPVFGQAAVDAALQSAYTPARQNDRPVRVKVVRSFHFRLR